MQITVTVPDELVVEASARGLSPEAYVESLIAAKSVSPRGYGASGLLTYEEFQAGLDRMTRYSHKIPDLPDEAFSRESMYSDHD